MKLIIGLGNPGEKYRKNRHNVGYLIVDSIVRQNWTGVVARKTGVFMNDSGSAVKRLVDHYNVDLSSLFIVHDDLDIPLGQYKIQFGVGPKDNNGIISVEERLNSKDFWRVRIGVDNRKREDRTPGEDYVLQDFTKEEREILNKVIKNLTNTLIV